MVFTSNDWIINIECAASRAASLYGDAVVECVFHRYDSSSVDDLAPCHYSEVFSDLEQIASDD